jgi:hypothetical protein
MHVHKAPFILNLESRWRSEVCFTQENSQYYPLDSGLHYGSGTHKEENPKEPSHELNQSIATTSVTELSGLVSQRYSSEKEVLFVIHKK